MSSPQSTSASVIMSPRQLKLFLRWQHLCTTLDPAARGYLPTAAEYEDFQQWLKRQDSGYFSDVFDDLSDHIVGIKPSPSVLGINLPVATICQHLMHPLTTGLLHPRCPVCTIKLHLNYVKILFQALTAAGGRAPSCTLTTSERQDSIYSAWAKEKILTLKELLKLENMADREAAWSRMHPAIKRDDIQTAAKALKIYWIETNGSHDTIFPVKGNSIVAFSENTNFELGRPQAYYWRRSPRYAPGKYTAIELQQDELGSVSDVDAQEYTQGPVSSPGVVTYQNEKNPAFDVEDVSQSSQETDEYDSESDWEDFGSDVESSNLGDQSSDSDHAHLIVEAATSFIVFADD